MDSAGTQGVQHSKHQAAQGVRAVDHGTQPLAASGTCSAHSCTPSSASRAGHAPVEEEQLVLWEGPALARDRMRAPAASPHLGHSGLSASITLAAQPLQQHWCTLHAAAGEGGRLHGGGEGGRHQDTAGTAEAGCRTALTAVQEGWVCADMQERYRVGNWGNGCRCRLCRLLRPLVARAVRSTGAQHMQALHSRGIWSCAG